MINNIIFDLGNVMLDFDPITYVKAKIGDEKLEEIYECIFKSEEWPMLDRGVISEEDAIRNIINRNLENEILIHKIFENWYDILTPIEDSVNVLRKLKENGYKVYYLSNFHKAAFEYINRKYDLFKLFDCGIFSYKEKLLKPEREIYERIINEYNLKPSETVFVDDMEVNIEGARQIGLQGIVLNDPKDLKMELERLNIKI